MAHFLPAYCEILALIVSVPYAALLLMRIGHIGTENVVETSILGMVVSGSVSELRHSALSKCCNYHSSCLQRLSLCPHLTSIYSVQYYGQLLQNMERLSLYLYRAFIVNSCCNELCLYWTLAMMNYAYTELLHTMKCAYTELLLRWTMLILNSYYDELCTKLLPHWTMLILNSCYDELCLYWTLATLNYAYTELLYPIWTPATMNYASTELLL